MAAGNKTRAGQAAYSMRMHKDISYGRLDTDLAREKRAEVIKQNGSCLSCTHTKTKAGIYLICSLKDKKVQTYNYCEKWKLQGDSND